MGSGVGQFSHAPLSLLQIRLFRRADPGESAQLPPVSGEFLWVEHVHKGPRRRRSDCCKPHELSLDASIPPM